jgi:hypothetical protein
VSWRLLRLPGYAEQATGCDKGGQAEWARPCSPFSAPVATTSARTVPVPLLTSIAKRAPGCCHHPWATGDEWPDRRLPVTSGEHVRTPRRLSVSAGPALKRADRRGGRCDDPRWAKIHQKADHTSAKDVQPAQGKQRLGALDCLQSGRLPFHRLTRAALPGVPAPHQRPAQPRCRHHHAPCLRLRRVDLRRRVRTVRDHRPRPQVPRQTGLRQKACTGFNRSRRHRQTFRPLEKPLGQSSSQKAVLAIKRQGLVAMALVFSGAAAGWILFSDPRIRARVCPLCAGLRNLPGAAPVCLGRGHRPGHAMSVPGAGRGPNGPGQRPPRPRRALRTRRDGRWPRSRGRTGSCAAVVAAGGERRCLSWTARPGRCIHRDGTSFQARGLEKHFSAVGQGFRRS